MPKTYRRVSFDPNQDEALRKISRETGAPIAELVRRAVQRAYIDASSTRLKAESNNEAWLAGEQC